MEDPGVHRAALGRREFVQGGVLLGAAALLAGRARGATGHGTRLGIWPGDLFGRTAQQRRDALERRIGRRFSVDRARGDAYAFNRPLLPEYIRDSVGDGRRAYLKLQSWLGSAPDRVPVPWAEVAAGRWDERIRAEAARARSLPGWHYMTFHAEPDVDSPGVQPAPGSPEEFTAAFDHVRGVFDAEGATRLAWVVVLTAGTYLRSEADLWMPERPVLVGVDGYNRVATSARSRSFAELFQPAVDFAAAAGRRVFIGETGCEESPTDPSYKASWIAAVPAPLRAWDRVVVVVWNHSDDGAGGWLLDSSRASLDAFRLIASDPVFS
jgi:hypothetical protein